MEQRLNRINKQNFRNVCNLNKSYKFIKTKHVKWSSLSFYIILTRNFSFYLFVNVSISTVLLSTILSFHKSLIFSAPLTMHVSTPPFLVFWSMTSGGRSLPDGFFLRALEGRQKHFHLCITFARLSFWVMLYKCDAEFYVLKWSIFTRWSVQRSRLPLLC